MIFLRSWSQRQGIRIKLFIATANEHKLSEICAIFRLPSLELKSMKDFPDLPEVIEDGATFEDNAIKKAVTIARLTEMWTIADDTGLEVDALGGEPGVYSARYAGEPVSYEANNAKLLSALVGTKDRTARFRCVIALSSPSGDARTVEGRCEGSIIDALRGDGGFGYDPLFEP
ncbi:MAG: non-canonical purine NTP pyrophosphatase, partial [Kiritimatiellae bacterium]|nr:non-canonical purine NTP pyrophosphatase [Kiritimatiellia bacterium]